MGKVETKQVPKELSPNGEGIVRIMYDTKEPPKNYIWCKGEDDYWIWNGKKWIPYEFELLKGKGCAQKKCCCVTEDEMLVKFEKFKKETLAALLKMNQTQDATNIADIRAQLSDLKVIIHNLEEFENYYTKEEVDEKTAELSNLATALNGSIGGLSRRLSGVETSISDILPILNQLNSIDHSQFVTARDVSEEYDLDPGEYIIGNLDGYATEDYVDRAIANMIGNATEDYVNQAIANVVGAAPQTLDTLKELGDALGNDPNFATTIANTLATKADKSELPEPYDDSAVITRIETLENKPFDEYLTEEEARVISASLNDLNDRVTDLEDSQIVAENPTQE